MNVFYNDKMLPCVDRFIHELQNKIYTQIAPVKLSYLFSKEPLSFSEACKGEFVPLNVGDKWGELWDCAWFKIEGIIPKEAKGKKIVLKLDIAGEALIYSMDGEALQGLTSGTSSFDELLGCPKKTTYVLAEKADGGEQIQLLVDGGNNDLFGRFHGGNVLFAHIARCDETLRTLWYDSVFLRTLLDRLDARSARYTCVLHALFSASVKLSSDGKTGADEALAALKGELDKKGGDASLEISALGHSHLDLAWLWPIRETKRKALRTFATALQNLKKYPDYVFCVSQPQQLEWVREQNPALFEKIKEQILKGRIEPVGAMWVEPDLNVSGGEALVRQVLYGQKYWKDNFNKTVNNAWLPDVFGFNAALPQILKKSKIDNLLTIKLSWNKYTKFPHHSFNWQCMDCDESVLVHMPPEGTYNSGAAPDSVKTAECNYIEKGISKNAMMLFGIGDGGGGPGSSHLENLKRMKNVDGLCPVKQRTAEEFFGLLCGEKESLPTFKGEMYLEKHQGTYTSQAKNKLYNSLMEKSLQTCELVCVLAENSGFKYPAQRLEEIWKEVLLYQFHDILPGSSIKRVYDESVIRYEILHKEVLKITQDALLSLGGKNDTYFNPTSFKRSELIKSGGGYVEAQCLPFGKAMLRPISSDGKVKAEGNALDNGIVRYEFGTNGEIVSAIDLVSGETLLTGGNKLNVYEDDGDAWDISDNYLLKPHQAFKLAEAKQSSDGITATRTQTLKLNNSIVKQIITLKQNERLLKIETEADFYEDNKMLRSDFVTAVRADEVECGIQFGKVKRTTLENNLGQYAVGEICAQKWIDYSQPEKGVALINDCKYGYRVKGGDMSVNLIRTSDYPGEKQDRGYHKFTTWVYLHGKDSEVERLAYCCNYPLISAPQNLPESYFATDCDSVICESIKKSEDGKGIIVRMFECRGKGAKDVKILHNGKKAYLSDMTEFDGEQVETLDFTPFEIKTIKLK